MVQGCAEGPEKFSVLLKECVVETCIVLDSVMRGFLELSSLASLLQQKWVNLAKDGGRGDPII